MDIQIEVINAFSINGKGGNPAGVVFGADALSASARQAIATAAGFPETAFVSASHVADYRLEFFTPVRQIPHCGHATIATFSYLKSKGLIAGDCSSKETIDGCRTILFRDGMAYMEQKAPQITPVRILSPILKSLNIFGHELIDGCFPAIVNTGNAFLVVPVQSEAILSNIHYDRGLVGRISEQYGLVGYYVFAPSASFDATTRMFAPLYGIEEEAGTGMAAGPLAVFLREVLKRDKNRFRIEQGRFMKPASPSLISVDLEIEGGQIKRLFAGGGAHVARQIVLFVDI